MEMVSISLSGLAYWAEINDFATEEEARMAAEQVPECSGFTLANGVYSLRTSAFLTNCPGATSWILSRTSVEERPTTTSDVEVHMAWGEAEGDNDHEDDGSGEDDEDEHSGGFESNPDDDDDDDDDNSNNSSEENESIPSFAMSMSDQNEEEDDEEEEDSSASEETESTQDSDANMSGSMNSFELSQAIIPARASPRNRRRGGGRQSRGDSADRGTPAASRSTSRRENSGRSPRSRQQRGKRNANPVCKKCRKPCIKHVAGTWGTGWVCDWPDHTGPDHFTAQDPLYGCETVIECNWGICCGCWDKITQSAGSAVQADLTKQLLSSESSPISCQYVILQLLNAALMKALPFVDMSKADSIPSTLASMIVRNRDLILEVVKQNPFTEAVNSTASSGGMFDLHLSRFRAKKNINSGKVDTEGRWSVFSQAFRAIHQMPPRVLRRTDRLYSTKFLGEHAQDAGGPYRESFDNYCQELQSPVLPLLLRTPNGRHAAGYNREKFILHPNATSSTQLSMLSFLGKLMGIAIRSKEFLALNIAPFVWYVDYPTRCSSSCCFLFFFSFSINADVRNLCSGN